MIRHGVPEVAGIGVIGCGKICDEYLSNLNVYPGVKVLACADIVESKARATAKRHGVPRTVSPKYILSDPDVDIILNLTIPTAHADVTLAAIRAGKHVYSEKPLATHRTAGAAIMEASRRHGVHVGCAPDTFLGGGLQTCRRLIDSGVIGQPIGATAFMMNHGPESWHPDPAFFYQSGGGPMFDMGPYYLSALINLIGPIRRVSGALGSAFSERTVTSTPRSGDVIPVEVPTHITALLEFSNGAIGTLITSFDVWGSDLPKIEVYGTEGSLSGPDPNKFSGPVRIHHKDDAGWRDLPLSHAEGGRGLGVTELAASIRTQQRSRTDAELAFHVLDVMVALHESAERGRHVNLESTCHRPSAIPAGLVDGEFGG